MMDLKDRVVPLAGPVGVCRDGVYLRDGGCIARPSLAEPVGAPGRWDAELPCRFSRRLDPEHRGEHAEAFKSNEAFSVNCEAAVGTESSEAVRAEKRAGENRASFDDGATGSRRYGQQAFRHLDVLSGVGWFGVAAAAVAGTSGGIDVRTGGNLRASKCVKWVGNGAGPHPGTGRDVQFDVPPRARSSPLGTPSAPCDTAPRYESLRPPRHRKEPHWQSLTPPRRDRPAATVVYFAPPFSPDATPADVECARPRRPRPRGRNSPRSGRQGTAAVAPYPTSATQPTARPAGPVPRSPLLRYHRAARRLDQTRFRSAYALALPVRHPPWVRCRRIASRNGALHERYRSPHPTCLHLPARSFRGRPEWFGLRNHEVRTGYRGWSIS